MSRVVPVRTCIGCRERAAKSDLLRLVVEAAARVVPDEQGRRRGRGAHLHPRPQCLELAMRRRAFPRAFRVAGPLDVDAVRQWIEAHPQGRPAPSDDTDTNESGARAHDFSMRIQR